VSIRGTIGNTSYNVVDTTSGQQLETMPEDLAYRQVYPGAIYQLQDEEGQMKFYESASLEHGVASLQPIEPVCSLIRNHLY